MRALGTRDRTQCLGDGDRPGSGAKGWGPGAPEPSPGRPFAQRVGPPGRPEFISSSLTWPAPPRRPLSRSRHGRPRLLLSPLSSCQRSPYRFAHRLASRFLPESVWVPLFGRGSAPCASICLGLRFLAPAPRPPRPLQSPQLRPGAPRPHWPGRSPPPPPAGPLRAPPFTRSLAAALRREGAARPGPALPPGRPDPGPGPRTSPYLIPAPGLRVLALPVAQLRSSLLPATSVRPSDRPAAHPRDHSTPDPR